MSPLKIITLFRLYAYCVPFDDMPRGQVHAPAMLDAFAFFAKNGLLADGVTHTSVLDEPRPIMGSEVVSRLTEKGQRLVRALCSIEPGDAA